MRKDSKTIEIRWHGRGGQGAVTSAEMAAHAAIHEGKYAQAFPSFGPERRGAPVLVFNRISATDPVRNRSAIAKPDVVVVLDPGLLNVVDVTSGLKDDGAVVVNSPKPPAEIKRQLGGKWKLAVVDAGAIAKKMLGVNIVNTTMLGAVLKATGVIDMNSLEEPIKERFGKNGKNNFEAAKAAFSATTILEADGTPAAPHPPFIVEKYPTWQEILPGCIVAEPGNASYNRTGDWKSQHPEYNHERCIKCGVCYMYCPEGCIAQNKEGWFEANFYYCKGCGICARECPTEAIAMKEEAI